MQNRLAEISKFITNNNTKSELFSAKQALFKQFDECGLIKGISNIKWDFIPPKNPEKQGYFPLWIADMDFPVPDCIQKQLLARVSFANYGYTETANEYHRSIINWYYKNYGFSVKKEDIYRYSAKTLTGLGLIIQAFSEKGESVIVLSPVYNMFFEMIKSNERNLIDSPMIYKERTFFIDFDDFEGKILKHRPKIFIFCNPHNPVGRVWKKEEIIKLQEICLRYEVLFVSDEVFAELVFDDNKHIIPFMAPFENNTILLTSLGKAFNVNSIETGYCIIKNPILQEKFSKVCKNIALDLTFGNVFSQLVTVGAYSDEGKFWLQCVREYIYENYLMMVKYLRENLNEIVPIKLEGCFILLCDFSQLGISEAEFLSRTQEGNIIVIGGSVYKAPGKMFRINIACSKKILMGALERFQEIFKKK